MNALTKKYIDIYYNSQLEIEVDNLKETFEKVFDIYVTATYDELEDSAFCKIHDDFLEGHNCVGCNLNDINNRTGEFLIQHRYFRDLSLTFTNFILLLYLQVEAIHKYFEIIQLQESYRLKYFKVFQDIIRWANFLKHPKPFMLVHHPEWTFEGRKLKVSDLQGFVDEEIVMTDPTVDTKFVNKYYSGSKKNTELYKILSKKEDVLVVFPDPKKLYTEFAEAQKKFIDMISNNEIVREMLGNETTIEDHFSDESEN